MPPGSLVVATEHLGELVGFQRAHSSLHLHESESPPCGPPGLHISHTCSHHCHHICHQVESNIYNYAPHQYRTRTVFITGHLLMEISHQFNRVLDDQNLPLMISSALDVHNFCCSIFCSARFLKVLSNRSSLDGIALLTLFIYKYVADTSFTLISCTRTNNGYVSICAQ